MIALALGCEPAAPDIDYQRPVVTLEPPAELDAAPAVLRIQVEGLGLPPPALALFAGELSDYYVGELRDGKVPSSLRERQIEGEAWFDARKDQTVFAPSVALVRDETYVLAVLGSRPVATIRIDGGDGPPYAERIWPPHEWPRGGGRWVFCGELPSVPRGATTRFDPGGIAATANPGADSAEAFATSCLRLAPESNPGTGVGVAPPRFLGIALDPASVDFVDTQSARVGGCGDRDVELGAACAAVLDDRVLLRTPGEPLLIALDVDGRASLHVLLPGGAVVVKGLAPESRVSMRGTATDLLGNETPFSVSVTTTAASPHVVLNEVLANPVGAEPAQEWIEIVNDGTIDVELGDYALVHSDGATALPAAPLPPDAFALAVAQDYELRDGVDVQPAPGTLIVRLPRLGLSNSGEALSLRGPGGALVSRFPAVAPVREGVSVARRLPSSSDSDQKSFGAHGGKGASPGWRNDIASP